MGNRVAVGGTVLIFALVAVGLALILFNTGESGPRGDGRELTYEELTRMRGPNDEAIQDAIEDLGGQVVRDAESAPVAEVSLAGLAISDADLKVLTGLEYLRRLDLSGTKVTDAGLPDLKHFRHLTRLDLSRTAVSGTGLAQVGGLSVLVLAETRVTDDTLAALKVLLALERLDLSRTAVTGAGLAHLKDLPKLRSIWLQGAKVTDAGLAGLRDYPSRTDRGGDFARILGLSDTAVTDKGVASLGHLNIEALHLARTRITGRVADILKEFKFLSELTIDPATLSRAELTDLEDRLGMIPGRRSGWVKTDQDLKKARSLGGPDCQVGVLVDTRVRTYDVGDEPKSGDRFEQVLDLTRTRVTDAGLKELRGYYGYAGLLLADTMVAGTSLPDLAEHPKLRVLTLGRAPVTDAALAHLPGFKHLETLELRETAVTDAGLTHVGRTRTLSRLDLTGTKITDAGLAALVGLDRLRVLHLGGTGISNAGAKHLEALKTLRYLNLAGTQVSDAGRRQLAAALPRCEVSVAARPADAGLLRLVKAKR